MKVLSESLHQLPLSATLTSRPTCGTMLWRDGTSEYKGALTNSRCSVEDKSKIV